MWIGYRNTIYYTVVGTLLNIVFTVLMAYPLARADLKGRGVIMKLLVFTISPAASSPTTCWSRT